MSASSTTPVGDEGSRQPVVDSTRLAGQAASAVIFLHVPKTAGTTLNRLIEWEYRLSEMYSVDPVLFEWSAAHLRKLPRSRLQKTRMFKGHMLFGLHEVLPQPATYITVLRDPVERLLSAFYYMRSYKLHPLYWKFRRENWTVEQFVQRTTRDNVQCKIIAGAEYNSPCTSEILEKAKHNLAHSFSVVGLSERFEESLALMKLRFGWKLKSYSTFNVTRTRPKRADLPKTTFDLIVDKNSFDVDLYRFAADLFEEAVSKQPAEVSRIAQELQATRERTQGSLHATFFSLRSATRKAINRAYSTI
jgi:Galactose-3-O-sulfotransferase